MKVSAQGGSAEPATVIDKTKHTTHRWPWFLPDGKHFIFLATNHSGGDPKQNGIYFGSVDSPDIRFITASGFRGTIRVTAIFFTAPTQPWLLNPSIRKMGHCWDQQPH